MEFAVSRNYIAGIRGLLHPGADPYAKGEGVSAILRACLFGSAEALDMMAPASPHGITSGDSVRESLEVIVLGSAYLLENIKQHAGNCENAKIATLKVLDKYKTIYYGDTGGLGQHTVLHYAALAGYPSVVNYLLSHTPSKQYIDVRCYDRTPLIDVIKMGYRDVFQVLLHHGADVHLTFLAWDNINYIHICVLAGHRDLFFPEHLLKHGVQIDRVGN